MKAGLDRYTIIKAAADLADAKGSANLTLRELAVELGVKPPALYNHIEGLDQLNKELMLYGWRTLEAEAIRSAVGKSADDAIRAMFYAYRSFVAVHPGVFEAMQWYNMYHSDQDLEATAGIVSILFQILDAYHLAEEQKVHLVRLFRGFLQGFLNVESHGGFGNPMPVDQSFDFALNIILNGIRDLKGDNQK